MQRAVIVFAVTAIVLVAAAPAEATFPGQNGKIAGADFTQINEFTSTADVFTINPDGSGFTHVTSEYPQTESTPAWSPDSSKIAFTTNRDGNSEIYVMNPDGTGQTRLTNNSGGDAISAWSPDGAKIAFVTSRDGNAEIYVMNADGSGQIRLTNNSFTDTDPAWSPDGGKIAFDTNRDGSWDIYSMNVDGTGETNLTNAPDNQFTPTWSPDGSKIAYIGPVGFQGGQTFVMNRDGSGQRPIVTENNAKSSPAWSPDGTKIAVWRQGTFLNPPTGIALINADGSGTATQLPRAFGPEDFGNRLDWGPVVSGYPRPRGATPFITYLVPAFKACTAPNRTHGSPLTFGSCSPPQQSSSYLTVGTPDANGLAAGTIGSVRYTVLPNQGDLRIGVSITGVLTKTALAPYSGELSADVGVRITDKNNTPNPGGPGPGTVQDTSFPVTVPCVSSSCLVATSANAVMPGSVLQGKRAIWQLGQVTLYDGGADGVASTTGDNTLFLVEGVFVP
jgi:dipeptidyl aminopeptidase/acylaminoacyl peptidase